MKYSFLYYILGIILFFAFWYIVFRVNSQTLNNLDRGISQIPSYMLIAIALSTEFVVYYLLSKVNRYVGYGFLVAVPAVLLWFGMFIIEMAVHPPDEE